jgi:hypothetical protein
MVFANFVGTGFLELTCLQNLSPTSFGNLSTFSQREDAKFVLESGVSRGVRKERMILVVLLAQEAVVTRDAAYR